MRVHVAPRIVGRKDAIAVLEVEFTSRARRVRVRGTERLEPLDLNGDRAGGLYDVPDALPRVHVPLRVVRDGPGKTHLVVTVEDATGGLAAESWEGDVVLDAPPVKVENRRTALLLAVFSLVVGSIVWFVGLPLLRARNPKVPALAGLARADAERRLKERGIAPVVQFVDAAAADEIGKVLAQSPLPDVVVDRDSTVTITVARGVAETGTLVPALVGRTEAEAASALVGTGFRLDTVEAESAETFAGKVIRQSPSGGTRAPAGARIEIAVGRGKPTATVTATPPTVPPVPAAPPTAAVPALVGSPRADAERALLAAGLVPLVESVERAGAVDGTVISQDPAGETPLPVGSTVMLRVAKSPEPVTPRPIVELPKPPVAPAIPPVPPVVVATPKPPVVPAIPPVPPVVVATPKPPVVPAIPPVPPVVVESPKPPVVPAIPPVPPVVAETPKPPAARVAPDVLGMAQADAENAIRAAGLEVHTSPEDVEEGDPEGLVLRQAPLAGDPSPGGFVEVYVGRRPSPIPVPPAATVPTAPAVPSDPPAIPAVPPVPPTASVPSTTSPPVVAAPPVVAPPFVPAPVTSNLPPPTSTTGSLSAPPAAPPPPGTSLVPVSPTVRPTAPYLPATPPVLVRPPIVVTPPSVARPAAPGSPVTLGSDVVSLPDLTGREAGDAIAAAIAAGLVPTVTADRDARAAAGRVRVQSPAAGTALRTGSPVSLSVGGGYAPSMIDVPSVVGFTTTDAIATLARYGIQAQVVALRGRPGVFRAGSQLVVAQTPAGRVTPALASYVRLYIVQ